jgi:hypothetical protein
VARIGRKYYLFTSGAHLNRISGVHDGVSTFVLHEEIGAMRGRCVGNGGQVVHVAESVI